MAIVLIDQEQGLDVEDMRVQTVERMSRLFAIVLISAQIVFAISEQWPPNAVLWLRQGIAVVIAACMTLSFSFLHPFPFQDFNCG